MEHFNISDYVDLYIEREYSSYMKGFQVDALEDYRETLNKNVRNLLDEFKDPQTQYDYHNTSIFQYFPLESLSQKEQYAFLDHLTDLKNKEGGVGNKFIYNLKKITDDHNTSRFDKLLLDPLYPNPLLLNENCYFENNRNTIRYDYLKMKNVLKSHKEISDYTIYHQDASCIDTLFNLYCDSIMQSMNYWVLGSPDVDIPTKHKILLALKDHITLFLSASQNKNFTKDASYSLETVVPIFICFLKLRNRCGLYWSIASTLKEEQEHEVELFHMPPAQLRIQKTTPMVHENLKQILNDGNIRCDHFDDKLLQTKKTISLLNQRHLRNASPDNLLDLKVYFRELFISKSKYKTTALNIAKKYLDEPPFGAVTADEVLFLNEKISRGYFREQTPLELFNLKNEIQHLVYLAFIELLLTYDITLIADTSSHITTSMMELSFQGINEALKRNGFQPVL